MNHSRYIRWQMSSFLLTAVGCLLITCATPVVAQQGTYHFPSYNSDVASVALAGSYSLKSQMPLYSLPTTSLHQMEKYYFTYSVLGLSLGDQKTSSALHSFALGYRLHKGLDLSIGTRLLRGEQIEVTNDLGTQVGTFRPTEATIDVAVAMSLTNKLDGYLRASYLHSNVGVKANGPAASLGITYHDTYQLSNGLDLYGALTATLDNVGPKLSYRRPAIAEGPISNSKVALPSQLSLQAHLHTTVAMDHTIGVTMRGGYFYYLQPYYGLNGSLGVEYLWKKFLSLQVGIGALQRQPLYSVGVGVEYKTISLNLAYTHTENPTSLRGTHLGLSHRF